LLKYILIINLLTCYSLANFNPFFNEEPKKVEVPLQAVEKPKVIIKEKVVYKKPVEKAKPIQAEYLGFISYKKNRFALINAEDRNFIVKNKDEISIGENIIKIINITDRVIKIKNKSTIQYINFSYKSR
jgi:Tfp pilus assembly protein PilP